MQADLAIADSGFMVLLWRILRGGKIRRISGLAYTQMLLTKPTLCQDHRLFLILPTEVAGKKALNWLASKGHRLTTADTYVAPTYGSDVRDEKLVSLLNAGCPDHIIIGIGGGTQEKLGFYLREHLAYRPAIHCIGAALGFLTGDQRPMWADRFYLGWLLRLARVPRRFARRFSHAFELPGMILRYGRELPPLEMED